MSGSGWEPSGRAEILSGSGLWPSRTTTGSSSSSTCSGGGGRAGSKNRTKTTRSAGRAEATGTSPRRSQATTTPTTLHRALRPSIASPALSSPSLWSASRRDPDDSPEIAHDPTPPTRRARVAVVGAPTPPDLVLGPEDIETRTTVASGPPGEKVRTLPAVVAVAPGAVGERQQLARAEERQAAGECPLGDRASQTAP